jgi:hypothetical protein
MHVHTVNPCRIKRLVLAAAMVIATNGCAEHRRQATIDSGTLELDAGRQPPPEELDAGRQSSREDREAWEIWKGTFVDTACFHSAGCATTPQGVACYESGYEAADMAVCGAAVMFYIANRKELDECISKYPTDCNVTPAEACPLATGDKEFETICK